MTTQTSNGIKKTPKQIEAVKLIGNNRIVLLEGGSRSGKTFIALYAIVVRALRKVSRHLICRFRFSHAKQAICYDTMPDVLNALGIKSQVHLNKTDWFYEFPNGSTIWIGGLDEKDRTEKILGNEYATVFLNEASQISYDAYEMIVTRVNPPRGMVGRILIDYNPPSIQHWGYKIFHRREFPDGRPVPDGDYVKILMNPDDNVENLSDGYIEQLGQLSLAKRKRFLEGTYSLDSGSLWRRAWIRYSDNIPVDLSRVVIGVDPAGTVNGDEVGIIVCAQWVGKDRTVYYVLDDYSCHGTPAEWAAEVAAAYNRWQADVVVAEKNYGGDMVEHTIKTAQPTVNVQLVQSSRGKVVRAEPISAVYETGEVYHRQPFPELEDEMCIYDPALEADSPNRMDALVFAMTEMIGEGVSILDVL